MICLNFKHEYIINTLLFLLIKCENPLQCKGISRFIIKKKNNIVFAYVVGIYLASLDSDVKLMKF